MTIRDQRTLASPVGELILAANDTGITHLHTRSISRVPASDAASSAEARSHLDAAEAALAEYFEGSRKHFNDLQLSPAGTDFQLRVWSALQQIPFGQTSSYGQLGKGIGKPKASRAVGMANNRNPIGIIIPCHRVIGADGTLVGYAGGLEMKKWLLAHEGAETAELFAK